MSWHGKERGFMDLDYATSAPIVVVTGFVATHFSADAVFGVARFGLTLSASHAGASSATCVWTN